MAWDSALGTPQDELRFMVGDTGATGGIYLLQDATYAAMLDRYPFALALGKIARALASQFAQEPDWYLDEGGVNVKWTQRVAQWQKLAEQYDPVAPVNETVGTGYQYVSAKMPNVCDNREYRDSNGWPTGFRS